MFTGIIQKIGTVKRVSRGRGLTVGWGPGVLAIALACAVCGCDRMFQKPRRAPVPRPEPEVEEPVPTPKKKKVRQQEPVRKVVREEPPAPIVTPAEEPEQTAVVPEEEKKVEEKDYIKVSELGFNPSDSTQFLQEALDSGKKKVIVDRQASDWITEPLTVHGSDMEIVLEDGVVIRALPGAFQDENSTLLTISGRSRNVTIRGEGKVRLVMNKRDYQQKSKGYESSEWRHALRLHGTGTVVSNLTLSSSGGDGIYVNGCRNTLVTDLVCDDHNRQGISVISCVGFTARNCRFSGTSGAAPECGLDIEPNHPTDVLKDILFENCVFDGNAQSGIAFYLCQQTEESEPMSIVFRDCVSRGNANCGIVSRLTSKSKGVRGKVVFERCKVASNRNRAVMLISHPEGSTEYVFKDCVFDGRGCRSEVPLSLDNQKIAANLGGVTFENTVLVTGKDNVGLTYQGMTGTGITGLRGTLFTSRGTSRRKLNLAQFASRHKPNPKLLPVEFTCVEADVKTLRPVAAKLKKPMVSPLIRGDFAFYQFVPKAGEYKVGFTEVPTQPNSGKISVHVMDRNGEDYGTFVPADAKGEVTLKAKGENLFILEVDCGYNNVRVSSKWPGCGFPAHQQFRYYWDGKPSKFHFAVPAFATSVLADVSPGGASAALCKRGRTEVSKVLAQQAATVLSHKRKPATKEEVWCLSLPTTRKGGSSSFRIGGDAVSVVSCDPDAVLTSVSNSSRSKSGH